MEVEHQEYKKIDKLLQDWLKQDNLEIEASFHKKDEESSISSLNFINVAKRLQGKSFQMSPQEDYLNIITPSDVRLTIRGIGPIHTYCQKENILEVPFHAIIKNKTITENKVFLEEYDTDIRIKQEIPLDNDDFRVKSLTDSWKSQPKAYRLIRRWSFIVGNTRIDMSIVRSSAKNLHKGYKWSFADLNLKHIIALPPSYEVEVELMKSTEWTESTDTSILIKSFIRGIGEVLRSLQKNYLLLKNTEKEKVLAEYLAIVKTDKFRGVHPINLEKNNMISEIDTSIPNIRKGYNVTDKADGLRVLAFCTSTGNLYMIDGGMEVYKTPLINVACKNSLLDGEWVTKDVKGEPIQYLLLFDAYIVNGQDVSQLPFHIASTPSANGRYKEIQKWTSNWSKETTTSNKLRIFVKNFQSSTDTETGVFISSSKVLDTQRPYTIDGLIFTPNELPLPQGNGKTFVNQFKWKPIKDNTIDFLITFEKDSETLTQDKVFTTIQTDTGNTVRSKILRLHVGSSSRDSSYDNPRSTVLDEVFLEEGFGKRKNKYDYKPVLFNPENFTNSMASVCYREIHVDEETREEYVTTEAGEPIDNRTIVEMRYDPKMPPGWQWIPTRIRYDKTERLQKNMIEKTLNSEKTANSVWNTIHDPVTESMIRTGLEEPSKEEVEQMVKSFRTDAVTTYYERKVSDEEVTIVREMRDFHNHFIKDHILYSSVLKKPGQRILDLASGKGSDIHRWIKGSPSFVLGIDISSENVKDSTDGSYKRYLNTIKQRGFKNLPILLFIIGDSRKQLTNGDAGSTEQEKAILRSLFGKFNPEIPIPRFVENHAKGFLQKGTDVISCMFALHYMFDSLESVNQLMVNIQENLKTGGYFIACNFDGKTIFDRLRNIPKGGKIYGREGDVQIWSIRKEYDQEELIDDDSSVGLAIDVEFITIGMVHREYIVSHEYLKKRFAKIGIFPLTESEYKKMGLKNSSEMFDTSYPLAEQKMKRKYPMPESVSDFSFMNRWYIFQRKDTLPIIPPISLSINVDQTKGYSQGVEEVKSFPPPMSLVSKHNTFIPSDGSAVSGSVFQISTGVSKETSSKKDLKKNQVFFIHDRASEDDILKIKIPAPGRWLLPTTPFPIIDREDRESVEYPTTHHFLAGMKIKTSSNKPNLAKQLMSSEGEIHRRFLTNLQTEILRTEDSKLKETIRQRILSAEIAEINKQMKELVKRHGVEINNELWNSQKDIILMTALRQRFTGDEKFRKILEAIKNSREYKYLLYYKGSTETNEHSGTFQEGQIQGDNKMGRMMMELVGM